MTFRTFFAHIALLMCVGVTYGQPVFPGAVGFGTQTSAGRGGTLYRVTNLNNSGPGSLRNAAEASGRREIVFEISGTIPLTSDIIIDDPYFTIAGQTAPSPGITLKGGCIRIRTHDGLVQHLRNRVGHPRPDGNRSSSDCIEILSNSQDVYNLVVDHCSFSWATDENLSVYSPNRTFTAHDITVSNCIVSESLMEGHENPSHKSDGALIGSSGGANQYNVTMIGNLFADNNARNPTTQCQSLTYANNVVHNWGGKLILLRYEGFGIHGSNIKGNVFLAGPDSRARQILEIDPALWPVNSFVYYADNIAPTGLRLSDDPFPQVSGPVNWPVGFTAKPASQVEALVLASVGARPADRDAVDERIIAQVRARNGRLINNQSDVGGWPVLEVNRHTFQDARSPNGDNDRDGYTNREEVLHNWLRFVGQNVPLNIIANATE